jgi:uncharacterized protein (TIGR02147 family)
MKEVNLFNTDSYVAYLSGMIQENRRQKGYREELAKAAGCHRTHISLVLGGRNHLTLEQACGMASFWKLGALEEQYFLGLVELARAGTPALRKVLKARLEQWKSERENLSSRFETTEAKDPALAEAYYLSWEISALHLLVGIKRKSSSLELSERLNLSLSTVENALQKLLKMGLVSREGQEWKVTVNNLHAPKGSVSETLHQLNWRNQASSRIPRGDRGEIHYTALYTLSEKDIPTLKEKIVELIEGTRKVVIPSHPEELVCFTCDFFRV